ncbi:hypothetical protein VQ03_04975 [Methylobacterium tarhaniae]|uniref:DUF308 domain-containing protein n=1 Tax=Methylobacterium tarhaniae TaxID=1187852 RepID=A0A0J6VXS5_9HYPH|nr:hypothetical protein [Methylobacterium tarhaniae]KMO44111.1 hypothetical protein VQ03_04975 [Methylobacterium tarhaniae]
MIVALSVLALLMLIGGLAAMIQGIPFVRLEVGWTMVIAGTVGASGGAVLLGITAAVARLARIERALVERASTPQAIAEPAAAAPGIAPVRAARSEPVLPPIPFPAAPPLAHEPRPAEPTGLDGGAALAAGAAVAAAGLAASELRLTRAEDPDLPSHEPSPQAPLPQDPSLQDPPLQEPPLQDRPPHEPAPPAGEVRPMAAGMREDAPSAPPAAEPPPAPEPVVETSEREEAARPEEFPHQEPSRGDIPQDDRFEEPPGKTVIGTYDSGGNTYTMYADGTIDADTPAGRFHFASIEELKVFRSAGGEGAARSA